MHARKRLRKRLKHINTCVKAILMGIISNKLNIFFTRMGGKTISAVRRKKNKIQNYNSVIFQAIGIKPDYDASLGIWAWWFLADVL